MVKHKHSYMFSPASTVAILAQASSALKHPAHPSIMPKKKQPVPVSDGNDEDFLKSLNVGMPHEAFRKWRRAYPTRACQSLGCIKQILNATPGKDKCPDQQEWIAHRDPVSHQEWFYALFLVPTNGRPTQPLAGNPKGNLFKVLGHGWVTVGLLLGHGWVTVGSRLGHGWVASR